MEGLGAGDVYQGSLMEEGNLYQDMHKERTRCGVTRLVGGGAGDSGVAEC